MVQQYLTHTGTIGYGQQGIPAHDRRLPHTSQHRNTRRRQYFKIVMSILKNFVIEG